MMQLSLQILVHVNSPCNGCKLSKQPNKNKQVQVDISIPNNTGMKWVYITLSNNDTQL